MFVLIIGMAALVGALGIFAYAVLGPQLAVDGPGDEMPVPAPLVLTRDPGELPALHRWMARLADTFSRPDYRHRVQRRLDLAGNPRSWEPERLMALRGFGLTGGLLIGMVIGVKHGGVWAVLIPVGLAAGGFLVPGVIVRNLGEKRQIELRKGLPDVLDILTVCVEAGLGFDGALGRAARNLSGPMAQECARVLQEMQIGKSRAEALRALAQRTDVPELRSFVSAVVQSGELGIAIGDVLREQAREMRIKRRQRAEEMAQKLQVKLLLPLITCLLPAIFVVVLGPAALEMVHFFGSVNA